MRCMVSWTVVAGVLAGLFVVGSPAARAQARRGGARSRKEIEFSDEKVAEAIRKGVEYLLRQQQADGAWSGAAHWQHTYPVGPTAIVVYALLESGLRRYDDAKMKKALDWMAQRQSPEGLWGRKFNRKDKNDRTWQAWQRYCHKTYSLGLRANAWLAAVKQGGAQYRPYLRNDARQLILSTRNGSYTYDSFADQQSSGDNSNSQYGVLGVWAAAQADMEVPRKYWYLVLKHWVDTITGEGGWAYSRHHASGTSATMTTAGLATLFVCFDNLLADGFVKCAPGAEAELALRPLNRALDWMDKHFVGSLSGAKRGIGGNYYLLYGVERVGLASGYKYFGEADWYKIGAKWLLKEQKDDGSWSGRYGVEVSTSYALLFLVRGRHAVLFNKLEFNGDWNNRPRDLASLTRWVSKSFEETTVNWQIVNLRVPPEEWHDAPILYISGSKEPTFTDGELAALRRYVHQGGTILSCTECNGAGFSTGIRKVYERMFPQYKLTELPADHEIYSINFKKLEGYVKLHAISNGIRPLVIHADKDLPLSWQLLRTRSEPKAFEVTANVAMYVTDKALAERALVARGAKQWPKAEKFTPARTVKIARLKYNDNTGKPGNYDPEPLAMQRFARLMGKRTATKVDVTEPIAIAELPASAAQIAMLVGTGQFTLSAEEKKALQQFIAGGGLLVVEAAGGSRAFDESAEVLLREIVPKGRLRRLAMTSPLFQQKGFEIPRVTYRRWSRQRLGITDKTPRLRAILDKGGQPQVILSAEDLSAGLLGAVSYELHGYSPASAFDLMRNIVVSKAKAVPRPKPKPKPKPARPARRRRT